MNIEKEYNSWVRKLKGPWSEQNDYLNTAKSYEDFASHVLQEYKEGLESEIQEEIEHYRDLEKLAENKGNQSDAIYYSGSSDALDDYLTKLKEDE